MNYTKNVLFLSAALMVLMMFYSCKDGNDPTPEPPNPPAKTDTVSIKIGAAADYQNNLNTVKNLDAKKFYMIDAEKDFAMGKSDLKGTAKEFSAAIAGKSNVRFNKNGRANYPTGGDSDPTDEDILEFGDWNGGPELGLGESPLTGKKYLAKTVQDSISFAGKGFTLKVHRENSEEKPGEKDEVFKVQSKNELEELWPDIEKVLETIGQFRVFVDITENINVMDSDMPLLEKYNHEKIVITGAGRIASGAKPTNGTGKALSPFNLGENGGNYFYVTNMNGLHDLYGKNVKIYGDSTWIVPERDLDNLIAKYVGVNTDATPSINARQLLKYQGETGPVELSISGKDPLGLNNFNVDVAGTLVTKAVKEGYNVCATGDPNNYKENFFGYNGPFRVVKPNGEDTDPTVNSMFIGTEDVIYESYYWVDTGSKTVDLSNSAWNILEKSFDITGKAPQFTSEQTYLTIVWNNSGILAKNNVKPNTELVFSTSFLPKLSQMFDLKGNGLWIVLNERICFAWESGETATWGNGGFLPATAHAYLQSLNLSAPSSAYGGTRSSWQNLNIFVRTANGWEK